MRSDDIHETKTHLSKLIAGAVAGEPFVIAKAGRPLVKVTAVGTGTDAPPRRTGFLAGAFRTPEDFYRMGPAEIAALFGAEEDGGAR